MAEALKKSRSARQSALTREINTILKFAEKGLRNVVSERAQKIDEKFQAFETAHEEYLVTLEDETEIAPCEAQFSEVQDKYIAAKLRVEECLLLPYKLNDSSVREDDTKEVTSQSETSAKGEQLSNAASDLCNLINLQSLDIDQFDGDPLKYHSFFAIFDENMEQNVFTARTKLTRLLKYTTGKAKEAIQSCALIGGEEGYTKARDILERRFGDHHLISDKIIKDLKNGRHVKTASDLRDLSDELIRSTNILSSLKKLHEINTQSCIIDIVSRLQPFLRRRWSRYAMDLKMEKDAYPSFQQLVDFIQKEADYSSDPVYGDQPSASSGRAQDHKPKRTSSSFTTASRPHPPRKYFPCVLCGENHRLFYCQSFKDMKPVQRLQIVKDHKLCENCLLGNHVVANCRKPSVCSVAGCGEKHTKFVHIDSGRLVREASSNQVDVAATHNLDNSIYVPVVPVLVNGQHVTTALLDTASNSSFCTKALVESLGVQGRKVQYTLNTMSQTHENKCSSVVDLLLSSTDLTKVLRLSNVYVVDSIPVELPQIDLSCYTHLTDVLIDNSFPVQILIGQDHSEALVPLEVRKGQRGDPFAVRTLFGWSVNGPAISAAPVGRQVISHFITTANDKSLHQMWELENDGLIQDEIGWSQTDRKVMDLWDSSVRVVQGHYELPIPWKTDAYVPNNIKVAESRLKSLVNKLRKTNLYDKYDLEIKALLDRGYAEPIPVYNCNNDKIWYLPHHAVTNDNKPGKIRVVFDCASQFEGESLNNKCYQGPDMSNQLLHVLLRFREHEFAIMADVEGMYHQVLVPEQDRDALRFLWWDNGEVRHYRMTRHIFGGVWSSCAATYALRHVVVDHSEGNALVDETVLKAFYVDDCLKSVASRQEACEVISGTTALLAKGGFRLTKFISNDRELLEIVPSEDRAKEVQNFTLDSNSKALGVKWHVLLDEFYFDVNVTQNVADAVPLTRRAMLSFVSSMFDPLGLLSPVLIVGRMLFQDATRVKLGWDEKMPLDLQQRWNVWLQSLSKVTELRFPRCVKPPSFNDAFMELHHFCDASERAYGSCSYLRCVNKEGQVHTAMLFSKSRVAPINCVSIPRLELQAALLAARVDSTLRRELTFDHLPESFFWSDSEIVLKYIKNETRRFHVYVSNRVGEIRRLTTPHQWRHIPGKDNPADVISRGQVPERLDMNQWLKGPEFLSSFKPDWQADNFDATLPDGDVEVKKEIGKVKGNSTFLCTANVDIHPLDKMMQYYSSWTKVRRAVVYWLRLKRLLASKKKDRAGAEMTLQEVKSAEVIILKHVQVQSYAKELDRLQAGLPVDKASSLNSLCPIIDDQGLLCVGGRLQHADTNQTRKHPIIVPHKHELAVKIAREFHEDAHLGAEWSLSLLRSKFWIINARSIIRKVIYQCLRCRRLNAVPCNQKMADLPSERLRPDEPPFSNVGLDCFGPFVVKSGRTERKRYGCIYTCLSIRAVHLEVLDSLETDSFLNGFRRFVARRGHPNKVWSDNGTNIVGGRTELAKALRELNQSAIQHYALKEEIEWVFNPPQASHMGGLWERLIRTVRKVFTSLLMDTKQRLTDEVLRTLFCEVESVINSRPITKVSVDATDLSALTPSHLLLLRHGPVEAPPGLFSHADMFRRRWRYVQYLADQFWRRWTREYIPELQKRQKWTRVTRNVKKDDLVLLCDESTPRCLWPLGMVVDVTEGRDGLVRSVKVRTKSTTLVRPITKVVLLEGA